MSPQALSQTEVARLRELDARYDLMLLAAVVLLGILGIVMVASASMSIAEREFNDPFYYLQRQLLFSVAGMVAAGVVLRIPMSTWGYCAPALLVAGMAALMALLVPGLGHEVNGSVRWFKVGPISVQPSEFIKLALVLYLAGYLVRRKELVRNRIRGFLIPLSVLVVIGGLLLLEPDYGAVVVLCTAALGMLFLGGVPFASFLAWSAMVGVGLSAIVLAAPYRMKRLMSFLDPWAEPYGDGFQLTQALIAIGRGDFFGVGLGSSVQKLFYLPEAHTDFVFAVLGEELGLVGGVVVIGLYLFVSWRSLSIGGQAQRRGFNYGAHVAYGLGLLFALQAFVNIGVNVGALPTKGLTLPLLSYGGSSMLATCIGIGLLLRVDHESRTTPLAPSRAGFSPRVRCEFMSSKEGTCE